MITFGLRDLIQVRSDGRLHFDKQLTDMVNTDVFDSQSEDYRRLKLGYSTFPVKRCKSVSSKIEISLDEMGKHVAEIYSGKSGQSRSFIGPFPITANGDWAFIMGLFYSSGGAHGNEIHFALEKPVIEYLQSEQIVASLRQSPRIVSQGQGRHVHGTLRASYGKFMLDVLKKFGLKTGKPFQLGRGKWVPSRYLALGVPNWIKENRDFLHRFVEGYINGLRCSIALSGRFDDGVARGVRKGYASTSTHLQVFFNVNVHYACYDKEQVVAFSKIVDDYLASLGIKGYLSRARNDGRRNVHYTFGFHDMKSLRIFRERFLLLKTMLRIKADLRLAATKDHLLYFILQRTSGLDNYVLGMLYTGPKTMQELVARSPRRPYNMPVGQLMQPSITKLQKLKVIKVDNGIAAYEPSGFRRDIIQSIQSRIDKRKNEIRALSGKLLYLCRSCSTVGIEVSCYHCGKRREPCARTELRRLNPVRLYKQLQDLGAAIESTRARVAVIRGITKR